MWPFERRNDVLRVGIERLELWSRTPRGLALTDQEHVSAGQHEVSAVTAIGASLLARQPANGVRSIDVVVESAWLPVMAIEVGRELLAAAQVEALLRHRIALVYGQADELGGAWDVRIDHRPGDRLGLGFGMPPRWRRSLLDLAASTRRTVASIQPAFAWGRRWLRGRAPRDGWLMCVEQDRTLAAYLRGGRPQALNAAAPAVTSMEQALRIADVETIRQGITAVNAPVVVAGWLDAPMGDGRDAPTGVTWVSMAAPSSRVPASARGASDEQGQMA